MAFETSKGDMILLLRYSDFHGVDTINEHAAVAIRDGFCWWAKLGKTPSPQYIEKFMACETHNALLYTAGALHRCSVLEISSERPTQNYPDYYDRDIFSLRDSLPNLFFKITNVEPVELSLLEDYVVMSSGKPALHDLKKTISSYFVIQHKDYWVEPVKKERKSSATKKESKSSTSNSSCIYRKDGVCDNRRCINYQYECERPSQCIKQKIK